MLLLKNMLLPCLKMGSLFPLKFLFLPRTLRIVKTQDTTVSAHTAKIMNTRTMLENETV